MSELMEHGSIDDVAGRAVAALRREVTTRSLPELNLRVRRPWVAPVLAVAAVAVVVVGLIAIGTNRNDSVGNDPARLHWLLRDLPSGWRPISLFDSTTAPAGQLGLGPFAMNVYATDAEPLGPFLTVQGTTDTTQAIDIGSYSGDVVSYEEVDLDGRRGAFATLLSGGRGLYVEINLAWVYMSSRGLSDDVLRELAATLAPDAVGHYDVAGSAVPDGMHKVVSASDRPSDIVSIDYSPPGGGLGNLVFAIRPTSPALLGFGSTAFEFRAASVDGISGFLGSLTSDDTTPPTTAWVVLWRRDGLEFALSGQGMSSDQILDAAASASQASPDEWASLLGSQIIVPGDTTPAATSPPEVPVDSEPLFEGEPRDVAIAVTVDDVSSNEQRWSGVLPSGESWSAKITHVYDRIDVRYFIDGNVVASSFGMSIAATTGDQVTCCNPMAITRNPNSASLRVLRSNGERYTIPLHELPGSGGVRVALIAIPDGTLLSELMDASGNVLESYAPH
jgi:hypothetical protein